MGTRPPHLIEQGRQTPRVKHADKPEPAIFGGTEHELMGPEEAESFCDMTGVERRDVGPDEHHRSPRSGSERPADAHPEFARACPVRLYRALHGSARASI